MRVAWPLTFGLGGALLIWGVSLLLPNHYTSTAVLRINVEPFPAADVINHAWQEIASRRSLKRLIERFNLYPEERDRLPLEDVIENAKAQDMSLDINADLDVVLAFCYPDANVAKAVAKAFTEEMVADAEDHARAEPGWGTFEVKQAAATAERVWPGLAFWKPSRYSAKATLVVHKQDNFKFDPRLVEQRAQAVKTKAFNQLRYSVESYGSVEDLNRSLRIDTRANILFFNLTDSDAKRAQLINSRLITGVIDDNQHVSDCAPATSGSSASNYAKANPPRLKPRVVPFGIDIVGGLIATPLHDEITSQGLFQTPAKLRPAPAAQADCRDPNTPAWARTIDILDPASLPETPEGPSRPILAAFGFFLGLGLWTVVRGR